MFNFDEIKKSKEYDMYYGMVYRDIRATIKCGTKEEQLSYLEKQIALLNEPLVIKWREQSEGEMQIIPLVTEDVCRTFIERIINGSDL